MGGDRSEAELSRRLALRPAHMRADNQLALVADDIFYGGQHGTDTDIVGYLPPLVHRHVKIGAEQHPPAVELEIMDRFHRILLFRIEMIHSPTSVFARIKASSSGEE